jgi:hypothetical protein
MKDKTLFNAAISPSNFAIASSFNACSSCNLATSEAFSENFDGTHSISSQTDSPLSLATELSPLGLVTTSPFPLTIELEASVDSIASSP